MDKEDTLPSLHKKKKEEMPLNVGPYHIENLLDVGGMAHLYMASHPEYTSPVALKVLHKKYLGNPDLEERFLREGNILSLMDHPNIIHLYDYGTSQEGSYIAMELFDGVSLRKYLQNNPLSLEQALEIALQLCSALCHIHTHGIIHRDLKPENILISPEGRVKIIDFGIAQNRSLEGENIDLAQFVGTPSYMSPEQMKNPLHVSFPSDVFSLGIIIYELVLGKLSHRHVHLSLMPRSLQKILAKALHMLPEERYQDMVEFMDALTVYLETIRKGKNDEGVSISSAVQKERNSALRLIPEFLETPPFWSMDWLIHKGLFMPDLILDTRVLDKEGVLFIGMTTPSSSIGMAYLDGYLSGIDWFEQNFEGKLQMFLEKKKIHLRFLIIKMDTQGIHVFKKGSFFVKTPQPLQEGKWNFFSHPELCVFTSVEPLSSKFILKEFSENDPYFLQKFFLELKKKSPEQFDQHTAIIISLKLSRESSHGKSYPKNQSVP